MIRKDARLRLPIPIERVAVSHPNMSILVCKQHIVALSPKMECYWLFHSLAQTVDDCLAKLNKYLFTEVYTWYLHVYNKWKQQFFFYFFSSLVSPVCCLSMLAGLSRFRPLRFSCTTQMDDTFTINIYVTHLCMIVYRCLNCNPTYDQSY